MTLSDGKSKDEDIGKETEDMDFESTCSSSGQDSLRQGDLNDLVGFKLVEKVS